MAQFYGEVTGNRGRASRMGTANSGMYAHIRGWDIGVRVSINDVNGKDVVTIWKTSGSNGRKSDKLIKKFSK